MAEPALTHIACLVTMPLRQISTHDAILPGFAAATATLPEAPWWQAVSFRLFAVVPLLKAFLLQLLAAAELLHDVFSQSDLPCPAVAQQV